MVWTEKVVARLDCLESYGEAQISHYLRTALDTADKVEERKESKLKELAEEILRGAASMTVPNRKLFQAFDIITSSSHYANDQLRCHEVLEIIVNFEDFDKVPCISAILTFLVGYLPNVNCSHFDDQEDCSTFVTNLLALFKWFWTAFEQVMKNESFGEKMINSVGLQVLTTANDYLEDVFIMKTLQLVGQKKIQGGIGTTFQGQRKLFKLAKTPALLDQFEILQKNIEKIHGEMEKLPLHYFNTIGGLQKRPGIRSLTSIFMSFRVLTPALEIAETIELIGTINNYGRSQVAVDILHACLLILLEEFPLQTFPAQITNDEKKLDIYRLNLINIFFKKFPQIFEILVSRGYLAWTDVLFAVDHLIRTFKQELDLLDYAFRSNSIRLFLETFVERKVMSKEVFEKAIQIRNDQIKANTDLNAFLIRSEEKAQLPPFALNNKRVYDLLIRNYITSTGLESNLKSLYVRNIVWQDGVCAWHCVEGDILELTHRLASLMYGHEKMHTQQGQNSEESLELFSLHFVLLSRISWFFSSLTLEELVTGPNGIEDNLESAYYKWAKSHVKRIIPKEEEFQEGINSSMNELSIETKKEELVEPKEEMMETETETADPIEMVIKTEPIPTYSEETRAQCLNLAHRQIFWNKERASPKDLLALVPIIGEVWLNEYKTRHPERSTVRELIQALKDVPVMILCLCQWLENQHYSLARFQLGEAVLESVEEQIISIEQQIKSNRDKVPDTVKQWTLLWVQCRLHLREISEHPPVFHPMSVFQKSVANRTLPKCERYEVPLANQMKDMWIYCQRQNWFSVRTLVLIDHLNKSNNQRSWITGLSYSTIKSETQDSVAKSIEMITTIILLDPVKAAAKAIEVLTDLLLMRDPTKDPEKPTIMQVPECTMPIVQATIQSLIIGVWLVNRRNETKEPFDKKRRRSSIEVEQPWKSLMNDDADELDVLNAFITNAINCLVSEALSGVMRPASSVIYHFLNFIARSEKNRFRDMLIKRIPQNMIFRLAVVDPYSLPLEVFSEFCEQDQQAHNESQLQYLFLLRKCDGI